MLGFIPIIWFCVYQGVPVEDLDKQNILRTAPIASSPATLVFTDKEVYVCNRGQDPCTIPGGTYLAGYYKGVWLSRDKEPDHACCVPFEILQCTDPCYFNGAMHTVLKCMQEKLATQGPESTPLAYHTIKDAPTPDNPNNFTVAVKYKQWWKIEQAPVKKETKDVKQIHAAGLVEPSVWETSFTKIIFQMKWAARGFAPVRPLVVTTAVMTIPPATAIAVR